MQTFNIISPMQTLFTVKTDCDALARSLNLKHGRYIEPFNGIENNIILAIRRNNEFKICFRDEVFFTQYALRKIEDIMYENRQYDKNIFAIHGAAVEYSGGAYLFIAATTSGKTTLAAFLTSNGFGYITDDCILLDRESFEVYPFTTPVHLRGGGYDVLLREGCAPENAVLLDDISLTRYVYTPENSATEPLPLKKIFFITRTEAENRVCEMNTTERITELLKSPITEYPLDGKYLEFISKLAKIPCKRLYYSDMKYVSEVLKNG